MPNKNYTLKQEQVARFAKAMGHPARIAILQFLGGLLFRVHPRRIAHCQGYRFAAPQGAEGSRTDTGRGGTS